METPVVTYSCSATLRKYVCCILERMAFVKNFSSCCSIVHPMCQIDFILVCLPMRNWERIFYRKEWNCRDVRIRKSCLSRSNSWIGLVSHWQHPSDQSTITSIQLVVNWESAKSTTRIVSRSWQPPKKRRKERSWIGFTWHDNRLRCITCIKSQSYLW